MAENNKENAKPKKTSKKKVEEAIPNSPLNSPLNSTTDPSSIPAISPQEAKALEELTQLARLEYFKALKTKIIKEKDREITSLDDQIREFLGPYILIGYDLNNQPVEIVSAQNPAEHDALLERFRRVMFKINQNIVNSNGEDPYGNRDDT